MEELVNVLDNFIEKWKANPNPLDENKSYEQLDDILVIGVDNNIRTTDLIKQFFLKVFL